MIEPVNPLNEQGQIRKDSLVRLSQIVEQQDRLTTAAGMAASRTPAGTRLENTHVPSIWVRITSGANPYAFIQVNDKGTGTYTDVAQGVSGDGVNAPLLWEASGSSSIAANTIHRAWPNPGGDGFSFDAAITSAGFLVQFVGKKRASDSGAPVFAFRRITPHMTEAHITNPGGCIEVDAASAAYLYLTAPFDGCTYEAEPDGRIAYEVNDVDLPVDMQIDEGSSGFADPNDNTTPFVSNAIYRVYPGPNGRYFFQSNPRIEDTLKTGDQFTNPFDGLNYYPGALMDYVQVGAPTASGVPGSSYKRKNILLVAKPCTGFDVNGRCLET